MTNEHQEFEREWWGNCANTFQEELKQTVYADRMGLEAVQWAGKWPAYDMQDKKILDIGGGPVSMLLKCENLGGGVVIDPCPYPSWTSFRYDEAGIRRFENKGEEFFPSLENAFDEVWIYNVLQHVEDPEQIIANAKRYAPKVRLFEWIDIPPHEGHPHELSSYNLAKWLGVPGNVEDLNESGCVGRAFYATT